MNICHAYILFGEVSVQVLCSFCKIELLIVILSGCKSSLYKLYTKLCACVICKYFLPICSLSFYSLDSVFDRAKGFNFDEVLFTIFIMKYAFSIISKNFCSKPRSRKFSPEFSSESFIIVSFTFRFIIYFELIFLRYEI